MKKSKGFIIGKFMPPHSGHLALFDKAMEHVNSLTVQVFSKENEPISGSQRLDWLRRLRPDINFIECTDNHPIDYHNPAIWDLWMASIRKTYSDAPDIVFASEDYGAELARRLDAEFFCFDRERKKIPVSSSLIREKPWSFWPYIPDIVRPHFVQKICIIGGESTGKSTLATALSTHYRTNFVAEYAREFLSGNGHTCTADDMPRIAGEQARREDEAQKTANRFLFCDTNAIVTKLWSLHYFKECSAAVESMVRSRPYHLYLLMRPDIPWVDDGLRDTPHSREWFFDTAKAEIERIGAPFMEIGGLGEDRTNAAISCINKHFGL